MQPRKAKRIDDALTNGVNPETNDVLSSDSELNNPQIICYLQPRGLSIERQGNVRNEMQSPRKMRIPRGLIRKTMSSLSSLIQESFLRALPDNTGEPRLLLLQDLFVLAEFNSEKVSVMARPRRMHKVVTTTFINIWLWSCIGS